MTMNNPRILIADDEAKIRQMMADYMESEFTIEEAIDGAQALEKFKENQYDLLILDVMMPRADGWVVCREVRKTSNVPIVMLTARGEEYDRLFGFELGVDDYIVKPFSPRELMARIKAILRRGSGKSAGGDEIELAGLKINFAAHNVWVDGIQKNLTPKEYELLTFFVKNPNHVFSRDELLSKVWGYDFFGDDRTVDAHIKMLRENLGPYRSFIVTVWGTGYKFEPVEQTSEGKQP